MEDKFSNTSVNQEKHQHHTHQHHTSYITTLAFARPFIELPPSFNQLLLLLKLWQLRLNSLLTVEMKDAISCLCSRFQCRDCRSQACDVCADEFENLTTKKYWLCRICSETRILWKSSGRSINRGMISGNSFSAIRAQVLPIQCAREKHIVPGFSLLYFH